VRAHETASVETGELRKPEALSFLRTWVVTPPARVVVRFENAVECPEDVGELPPRLAP